MPRYRSVLALAFVFAAIGGAGLAPFDFFPTNAVRWLKPGPGVAFDGAGLVRAPTPIRWDTDRGPATVGIEVWLRAQALPRGASRSFLVLLDGSEASVLGMRQEGADLVLWDRVFDPDGEAWYDDFRLRDVLRPGVLHHVAMVSDGGWPRFLVDGSAVRPVSGFPIPIARAGEPVGGRLVLGASPPWTEPWTGEILGLVLWSAAPSADQLRAHAAAGPGAIAREPGILAAYAFDEGSGATIHDRSGHGPALEVPGLYRPPGRRVLSMPAPREWIEAWNIEDSVVNLLGFVPLGLVLVAVLGGDRRRAARTLVLVAVGVGGVTSLGIELAQVLLVTRSSSLQDVVLNTAGSYLGAWIAVRWRRG